jgi:hypothetical protein
VTLSVDKALQSGSARASVPLTTCTYDADWNSSCSEDGNKTISVSWTGRGDLARVNGHYTYITKGTTSVFNFRGTSRDASATGQIDGAELATSRYGALYNSTYRETSVCHGGC